MSETILVRESPNDPWTVNGSPDIGTFPAGILPHVTANTPIRLQRGNAEWGSQHIEAKHGHWLKKFKLSAGQMVWTKCQQAGTVYTTEADQKYKVSLRIYPSALLLLRYMDEKSPWFRVVTIYLHTGALDGQQVGKFQGIKWAGEAPTILAPQAREISVRVKRTPATRPAPAATADGTDGGDG